MKTIIFLIGVDVLGFPIIHKHNFKEFESSFFKKKTSITSETLILR